MRFRGDGVGHKSTREATQCLRKDRDPLDEPDRAGHDAPDDKTIDIDVGFIGHDSDEESAEDDENSGSEDSENDEEPLNEYDAEGYGEF